MGAMWWARTRKQPESKLASHNFPDGEKRSQLKDEDPSKPYEYTKPIDGVWFETRCAMRGAARPDIPTPVSLFSKIRRCSRRRIQISGLFAATVAIHAACRRTSGTARGRPPVIKLHCISTATNRKKKSPLPLYYP